MTNEEFIEQNRTADVNALALKRMPDGIDTLWCLRQIEGYQLARKKLPLWADTKGVWFPPRLSLEQCSSEATAQYKQKIVARLSGDGKIPFALMDITGGFAVDFSYMARGARKAVYVEQQKVLCDAAKHNLPLLGMTDGIVINAVSDANNLKQIICNSVAGTEDLMKVVFVDPARRDGVGRKIVAIADCTPDISELQNDILGMVDYMIVKLSPMLDITQALRELKNVIEVHVVSVKGECKELLFVMGRQRVDDVDEAIHDVAETDTNDITFFAANLSNDETVMMTSERTMIDCRGHVEMMLPKAGMMLYEPNASVMKAGMQDLFGMEFGLKKIHAQSNLFVGIDSSRDRVPARIFDIVDVYDFSKADVKRLSKDVSKANLAIRNFPSSVDELRKRLKLKDGGDEYLFATTTKDEKHVIIRCHAVG